MPNNSQYLEDVLFKLRMLGAHQSVGTDGCRHIYLVDTLSSQTQHLTGKYRVLKVHPSGVITGFYQEYINQFFKEYGTDNARWQLLTSKMVDDDTLRPRRG